MVKLPSPEGKTFGATLRRIRGKKARPDGERWSQADLAKHAKLTVGFISDLERGVKLPSIMTLIDLARALGCSAEDLLADLAKHRRAN